MGIGPNKVYSYISVAIIGFLPLASFLIFGAQWSHLALFCQNPVLLLSDGRIPDSHAFWVMTSRTFSFLGGGVGSLCSLLSSFSIFSTCQVGHLVHSSISHILTSWTEFSKFVLFADCRTLHPPRSVVCRPRQTREDVHILVATIQWSSDTVATWYFRNLNGSRCPKTRYCPKTWVFAILAGFLRFHTNNGFLHWKNYSNFRYLALYSKQFQTFNFAPKFQNF